MDIETLFSRHYRVGGLASLYPVCQSLPLVKGIKGTNGAPNHVVAHTNVNAGLPTLALEERQEPVWQRSFRSTQGWSVMDAAASWQREDGHGYKGLGTTAKASLSRGREAAPMATSLRQTRRC